MVAKIKNSDPWSLKYQEQPELMRELNSRPARITINGKRHYHTPFVTGPAPSVTTILSETASEANKRKLEMWSKANPGVKELAAERLAGAIRQAIADRGMQRRAAVLGERIRAEDGIGKAVELILQYGAASAC